MQQGGPSGGTEATDQTTTELARAVVAGRYRPARLLKGGQGVQTWSAHDLEKGADVVLKTVAAATLPGGARERLEHAAEVLGRLRSPWLRPLLAVGRDGDLLYVVLPFLAGVTLEARLRSGPLEAREAIAVGRCVLEALEEAHAAGVLHRDVKPANVIVAEAGAVERATLIDFGLARSERLEASIRDQPVGTVRYVAPEQAGLIGGGVDARSDLYSVGAMLYECLAGRPAFGDARAGEVLRAHLGPRPPHSRSLGRPTPRALDEVVARLLRIDPRDRYQSAAAAAADLDEIARALDAGDAEPAVLVGARDRRRTLAEPAFIGRAQELALLAAALERARAGRGGLVLLEAPSGGGKTRLLEELARHALRQGALVLRGQGLEAVAARPFQVLEGVARDLLAAACDEPVHAARLRERLGPHREAALAALPQLAGALGAGQAGSLGREAHGEARTLRALAALLDALGAPERPAALLLDDCQWVDELTAKLLAHWQSASGRNGEGRRVLVVVSFRTEDVPPDHALRAIETRARVVLRPFDRGDLERLVQSMAGTVPDEAVEITARLSEGNPFLAAAVLQGMVEAGALVEGPQGWRVEPAAMAELGLARRAAVVLARRLERLPPPTLRLLSVGALLGKEFDVHAAEELCGARAAETAPALAEARRRQIVWTDAGGRGRCTFVHDKLRAALLGRLEPDEARRLHRLAAERLERLDRERVFELTYHFDGAGEGARALPYALEAAERARSRHALEVAERYYRIADRAARAAADAATRLRAVVGLADVLTLRGRYDEGARLYEAARALTPDRRGQAEIEGKIGNLEIKRSRAPAAAEALKRALGLLGRRVPRTRGGLAVALVSETLVQALHTWFPRLLVGRRRLEDESAAADLLAVRLLNRLSFACFVLGRVPLAMLWAHLRELNLAERYPPTPELGCALAEHGWILSHAFPNLKRGRAYEERAAAMGKALGRPWEHGDALRYLGAAQYVAGRCAEAVETLREAERVLERVGDAWGSAAAQCARAHALYRLGRVREGVELARQGYELAAALHPGQGSALFLSIWATLAEGRIPEAFVQAEVARPKDHVIAEQAALLAKGLWMLAEGRTGEAARAFEEADRILRETGVPMDFFVPIPVWLASALRAEAARAPAHAPRRRRELLRRAARAARRGLKLARKFRNNLPHALREAGLVAAARGRERRARRLLGESLAAAERQGALYERARTLLARGEVGLPLGWRGAAEDRTVGRRELEAVGANEVQAPEEGEGTAPATLSLADRFATLLEAGRAIASALTREAVLAAVREAAQKLLRAERCLVIATGETPADPSGGPGRSGPSPERSSLPGPEQGEFGGAARPSPPQTTSEEGVKLRVSHPLSATLVRRALEAGHPVVLAEGPDAEAPDSAVLDSVRSALCAPIVVHGHAAACVYVTHRHVGGLFGEEEERLAEFVATLAGAALENVEGLEAQRRADAEIRRLGEAVVRSQEEERRRLALALHDGAGQVLPVLGLRLHELRRRAGEAAVSTELESMGALVEALLQDLRRLARDLRPAALDRLGLAEALRDLIESVSGRNLEVELRIDPPDLAPAPAAAIQLYRVAQAALANIVRHAQARRARVTLVSEPAGGAVRLEVEDDGRGFDPGAARAGAGGGIGLIGMRERAAWLGGTFALESAPGRGTRIRVVVPAEGEPAP